MRPGPDDLFERASQAGRPTIEDLVRTRAGLETRLSALGLGGTAAAAKLESASLAPNALAGAWGLSWLGLVLAVPLAAAAFFLTPEKSTTTAPRPAVTRTQREASVLPVASLEGAAPERRVPAAEVLPAVRVAPSRRRAPAAAPVTGDTLAPEEPGQVETPPEDVREPAPLAAVPAAAATTTLVEEVRLLRAADAALRRGDAGAALRGFEQHARRFPQGVMREEAEAGHIAATCALQGAAGSSRARAFAEAHPRSLALPRVRAACGVLSR